MEQFTRQQQQERAGSYTQDTLKLERITCSVCDGKKGSWTDECLAFGYHGRSSFNRDPREERPICPFCNGTGKVEKRYEECSFCGDKGYVLFDRLRFLQEKPALLIKQAVFFTVSIVAFLIGLWGFGLFVTSFFAFGGDGPEQCLGGIALLVGSALMIQILPNADTLDDLSKRCIVRDSEKIK